MTEIHTHITLLDYMIVLAYVIVVLAIGFGVSLRKEAQEDLFLGGRRLGWFTVGLSIFGTNVSPSMMVASFGMAYTWGIMAAHVEWFAWFFIMLLCLIFIPHYMNTGVTTMPEFLEKRFSPGCRTFLSFFTLFSTMMLWIGGALFPGGELLSQIMGWPYWVSTLTLLLLATSFTVVGGLTAVVVTDTFQAILMILTATMLAIIGFVKVGGFEALSTEVPAQMWDMFLTKEQAPEFHTWAIVFGYSVAAIWFWCTDQTIVQRTLGARSVKHGQYGTYFATCIKVFSPFIYFVPGIFCFVLFPGLEDQDEAYMTMVVNFFPAGMVGLVIAVLTAALVSTVDSGLNSLSTVFTMDIYKNLMRPNATRGQVKRMGRIVTVAGAAAGYLIAMGFHLAKHNSDSSIFIVLSKVIQYLSPSLGAVFLTGVLWKRANATAALSVLIVGNIISVTIMVLELGNWLPAFFPSFLITSVILFFTFVTAMVVISLATAPPPPEKRLSSLADTYRSGAGGNRLILYLWIGLAVCMVGIYVFFQR